VTDHDVEFIDAAHREVPSFILRKREDRWRGMPGCLLDPPATLWTTAHGRTASASI
jgi:hypothetical protein